MFPPRLVIFASCLLWVSPAAGGSAPGIGNFYQVDEHLYRGAQPTDEGFRYLAKNGVKLVIDLRETDLRSVAEQKAVSAAGMQYLNVPMTGMIPPTEAEIVELLRAMEDPARGPVFVHCKRGADRTGAVIAAYRIHHDHWKNEKAVKEAMADGMSVMQFARRRFIRTFQSKAIDPKLASLSTQTTAVQ